MEQTLHGCPGCTNDRVLVDKITYRFTDPSRATSWFSAAPTVGPASSPAERAGQHPIRAAPAGRLAGRARAAGRAGLRQAGHRRRWADRACCDEQNRVLVDGNPLNEPYIYCDPGREPPGAEFGPVTVPQGTCG